MVSCFGHINFVRKTLKWYNKNSNDNNLYTIHSFFLLANSTLSFLSDKRTANFEQHCITPHNVYAEILLF